MLNSLFNVSRFFALLVTIASLTACSNIEFEGERPLISIGNVTAATGYPILIRKSRTYMLADQAKIYLGDIIETDQVSKIAIQMTDKTQFSLGSNSHFVLHTYEYSPNLRKARAKVSITSGSLRTTTSDIKSNWKAQFEIKTPLAIINVDSADFWCGYVFGENQSRLDVTLIKGTSIITTNIHGSAEVIQPGFGTTVIGRSAPQPSQPWSKQKTTRALAHTTLQ